VNRRTLDILVPIIYALAVAVAAVIAGLAGVVGVVLIGAVCVAFYYVATRQNIRNAPNDLPMRQDPPGHTYGYSPGAREHELY
jgi:Flp pilus assembly protein TadB